MASNMEIKIMNECKRKGLDPEEVLQLMQVPFEWTGNGYLFDFDILPVEKLSNYIDYIFRKHAYHLEKGTTVNGFYSRVRIIAHLPITYRHKTEIYSNEGKTFLEISFGKKGYYSELEGIVDQIIYLKPLSNGYLVCNKCGSYYELQKGESPDSYRKNCECGGTFKYIKLDQIDEAVVERKKTSDPLVYLRVPIILVITSFVSFLTISYTSLSINLGIIGLGFGIVFILIRVNSRELVFNMILRRLLYFFTAILFFTESVGFANFWLQIDSNNLTWISFLLFTVIAIIFGFGMIFKTISPDNPRNLLDPPL